jgi:tetratricopeptide (TPR) repeat protein
VGRYLDDGFHLTQFFVRSPQEEAAMLAALSEYLDPCAVYVTFNGKSFDAPLLNSRYTLQALTSPLIDRAHLDLLPLARRLWRDRLASRALKSLEVEILGAARTVDEVPGYLIPEYYFEYLRSGDARPLQGVFYHNAMDIVALAALCNYVSGMLADPLNGLNVPGLDYVAMGKLFEELGELDLAVALYEQGLKIGLPEEFFWRTVERFAHLHKKRGEYDSCARLWEKAAEHGEYYAYVELAKYYEHTARDVQQALYWTEAALERISAPGFPVYMRRLLLPELDKRLKRLKGKWQG